MSGAYIFHRGLIGARVRIYAGALQALVLGPINENRHFAALNPRTTTGFGAPKPCLGIVSAGEAFQG
ncbi:hypothetical protein N7488_001387 [Penicillium malachiteum]|nr:hypothetical protein N7488_001387 [Penicillium malachiteum]